MAAPVDFGCWFGTFPLRYKPSSQMGLTLPEIREDRLDIEVVFRRQLFARSTNVRHDRVFPHDHVPMSSSGVQMTGIRWPNSSHTTAILRAICAFAKCLQFQVNR